MTTSKSLLLLASAALLAPWMSAADGSPSAAAYYQANLKDRPQGVYEWNDKLFVQVRVSHDAADSDDVSALVLLAEHNELYAWLAAKAGERKKDPELPFGLARVRRLVRRNYPVFEYTADWKYDLNGQEFSREEGKDRVACMVCDRKSVEDSMPPGFLDEVPATIWYEGAKKLVGEMYLGRANVSFMAGIGLLDCAAMTSTADFDAIASEVGTPAHDEYKTVEAGVADYLKNSGFAAQIRAAKDSIGKIAPTLDKVYDVPSEIVTTNILVNVTTNTSVAANTVTNVSEVASRGVSKVMPRGGTLMARRVQSDQAIITTVRTETVVSTRRILVRDVRTDYFGVPKFEELFLGGGLGANARVERTAMGRAAEKAFFAPGTAEEHERAVMEALRENPGDKVLWNLLGRLLQGRKDWWGALVCFRAALRLDREYQYALVNLAATYEALEKRELAAAAAMVAYGVATDAWCLDKAKAMLGR